VQTHTIQSEQVGIIPLPRVGGALSTRYREYQVIVASMSMSLRSLRHSARRLYVEIDVTPIPRRPYTAREY